MEEMFRYADAFGPAKILHVYEPSVDLKAILVVDNVAKGPSIGGLRMAQDVSTKECVRLARAMTLKNAAAGLPHGGGKSVMFGDPKMPKEKKEAMIRCFAQSLRHVDEYIFGPDMGTDEEAMAWVRDEIGRSVGLPREVGGIPLDEIGATGWGLCNVVDVALSYCDFKLEGARIAVQGFGSVGKHAARFLTERGAVLVAAADTQGTLIDMSGIDVHKLIELKDAGRSVTDHDKGEKHALDAIVDVKCDIWIPAARPDVINKDNVQRLRAKLVVEGANIPVTEEAERILHDRGVLCVPDYIANAGGVICAAMEYAGASQSAAMSTIEEKVRRNTQEVLSASHSQQILPRAAANALALNRVRNAMKYRRYSLFSCAPKGI